MGKLTNTPGRGFVLETLLFLYLGASLLHFVHNAEFVNAYPNLPAWITQSSVYLTWVAITAIGVVGYLLNRNGLRLVGFLLLCIYAAIGLDGLLHYTLAPIPAHSNAMNFTIWFEVVVAAILLGHLVLGAKKLTAR
jgi:hypothetical protein